MPIYYLVGGPSDGMLIDVPSVLEEISVPHGKMPCLQIAQQNINCHGHPFDHNCQFYRYLFVRVEGRFINDTVQDVRVMNHDGASRLAHK